MSRRRVPERVEELAKEWDTDYGRVEETAPGLWVFATGGWSENEQLMETWLRRTCDGIIASYELLYLQGGLYVIPTTPETRQRLEELRRELTERAWKGEI